MDERLLEIVKEISYRDVGFDTQLLEELTIWRPHTELPTVQWDRVRHLHIIIDEYYNSHMSSIPLGIYSSNDGTWVLLNGEQPRSVQWIINRCMTQVEFLNIAIPFVGVLDVSAAENLQRLRIVTSSSNSFIQGIDKLRKLESLTTVEIGFKNDLDLTALPELKHLSIYHYWTTKTHPIDWKGQPTLKMETLCLSGVAVTWVPDLTYVKNLRQLSLINSWHHISLDGIGQLENLEHLDIRSTHIRKLPEELRNLKRLRYLNLSDLYLEEIPYWLPELGLPSKRNRTSGIILLGTSFNGVDMSIFDQPEDVILQWFEDLKRKSMVPLQEVKVVFLGDGEAGKTHTIARLLNDGNAPKPEDFDDKATPGIVIKDKPYELDGKTVNVHFWDFGGQEILHSMHRMFLTERTLYVVLLNARDDTQDDRARYWLHNIRAFAGESPVVLVLNKIDQNPNANVNEPELKELYGGLRRVVNLSSLEYTPEQFNAVLTDALKEEIRDLGTVGTLWPASWAKLKTGLETMESKYITGTQYKRMCLDSGVDKNQKDLLHWFNDLGVSFCYEGNRRLEHYVILRPEWITNGIYILLFNKSDETKNGVIPKQVIYEMLDPEEGNVYRRVLAGVTYDVNETEYVLEVMRKFRLSYAVSDRAEFIPALCQRNSMPIATEYANDLNALEFRLTYDYLPDNVIHRLMVEMRQDLQLSDVWRTGALFRQTGTGLSAVVKSEGDVLRIFVRSDNLLHRPNTYLCILKDNIDRINRDMKLAAPFAEVVYKTVRGKELFDYEDLLNAFDEGREGYRSKKLRRDIPIQDILNQTGRGAELALEKLRDDIITACLQMQQNRSFWTATEEDRIEDERNTYLRDTLINLRYKVSDQHLQGLGGRSCGYGELDLDIRRESAIPWTILEALRIKDGSKTDWNRHLKKLLDNYNPSGMRHLFLLTYVDCGKDDFEEIVRKFSEHIKWHDEGDYVRLENTFSHIPLPGFGDPHYLKVMRCAYDRSGAPTTVTHIFVRMGE